MKSTITATKSLSAAVAIGLASIALSAPAHSAPTITVAGGGIEAASPLDGLGGIGGKGTARIDVGAVLAAVERDTKSPFDSLGGIGGKATARSGLPAMLAGGTQDHKSPFESLGGIGGKGTAHFVSVGALALHDGNRPHTPFDSLGGIGGQGTHRSVDALIVAGGDSASPFQGLGGVGGRDTA